MNVAAILSIGDELLGGQINDSNAKWLSSRLVEHGFFPVERRTVGDDRAAIGKALRDLSDAADLVVVTGGLGPTLDDLTRIALTDVVDPGCRPVEDAEALRAVEAWFESRQRTMPVLNRVQALRPPSARILDNPHGTAPGLAARTARAAVYCLPGPPSEMMPMFERFVRPELPVLAPMHAAVLRCAGIGESDVADRLGTLMRRDRDVLVGTTASGGVVSVRVRAIVSHAAIESEFARTVDEVRVALDPYLYGDDETTLAGAIAAEAIARSAVIVTCESCTGGAIGAELAGIAGASAWFAGGWITYSNEAKVRDLSVPRAHLEAFGAVSAEVAADMALGGLERAAATHAVAVTGIAGPDGGTDLKPVGTVCIAVAQRTAGGPAVGVRAFRFPGNRATVQQRTVLTALQALRLGMIGRPAKSSPLAWERSS